MIEMFIWIVLLLGLGSYCYYLSGLQPFPEKGSRFSIFLFTGALVLWIASTSPEGSGEDLPASISVFLGGVFVLFGIRDMSLTKTDVIVAPLAGVLFCIGGISLLSSR